MRYAHRLMRGTPTKLARFGALFMAVLLLATGCSFVTGSDSTGAPTTTTADTALTGETTTAATTTPTESTTAPDSTAAPTVTVGAGVDPEVADRLVGEVDDLITATEQLRGLEFLATPTITILSTAELADRVAADVADELVPEDLAVDTRVYQLLGLLDPGASLDDMLVRAVQRRGRRFLRRRYR